MPKAASKEPKAPAKDRDLTQDQLLYAIILQMGTSSGGDAWAQVAARVPDTKEAEAARGAEAVRGRWNRLKAKWDASMLLGEKHYDITEEADNLRGQPKKEKKKAEVGTKKAKAKAKGKGKEKAVEVKKTGVEEQDEDVEDGAGHSDEDNGGEGSSRVVAATVKKPKEKQVKPVPRPTPAVEMEDEEESDLGDDTVEQVEQEV